jgi:MSHA biogenesis protein MshJ
MLVTPAQMPRLLQSLMAKHSSLTLVSLKSLPAAPLLSQTQSQVNAQNNGQKDKPSPGGIYRHAVEITIAGSYADLSSYAAELQRMTPRPLWSALQLKVVEYPRSELTFTLYTLSLDLPWLAV